MSPTKTFPRANPDKPNTWGDKRFLLYRKDIVAYFLWPQYQKIKESYERHLEKCAEAFGKASGRTNDVHNLSRINPYLMSAETCMLSFMNKHLRYPKAAEASAFNNKKKRAAKV